MGKKVVLLAVVCLLMVMAGCSSYGKTNTPAPAPATSQNQQIATTQTTTNPVPAQQNQVSALATESLGEVDFIDQNTGYLTATLTAAENEQGKNELLKTVDGGHSWEHVYSGEALSSLQFLSEDVGYAVETGAPGGHISTRLLKTLNGGATWSPVPFFVLKNPDEVDCANQEVIFVAAVDANSQTPFPIEHIYRTISGGRSWEQVSLPGEGFWGVMMSWLSSSEGYVLVTFQPGSGNEPKTLYHTVDCGRSWTLQSTTGSLDQITQNAGVHNGLPMGGYATELRFYPDGVGYLGETRGFVYKTTDGGKTFQAISNYADNNNTTPDFLDHKTGYFISGGTLLSTKDGGATWAPLWPPSLQ
jgi:photosystem II stability/assembly factor-like uncharacterized protein